MMHYTVKARLRKFNDKSPVRFLNFADECISDSMLNSLAQFNLVYFLFLVCFEINKLVPQK